MWDYIKHFYADPERTSGITTCDKYQTIELCYVTSYLKILCDQNALTLYRYLVHLQPNYFQKSFDFKAP